MILGPISYLDCIIFCIFLAPQLLLDLGLIETIQIVIQVLPFLLFQLPKEFINERYFVATNNQPAFVQQATAFEDFVVRCVRYAFAHIPPKIGRVFFGKNVALPWMRWRMLRHGYIQSPIFWREYRNLDIYVMANDYVEGLSKLNMSPHQGKFRGIWAIAEPHKKPDIVVYYAHGGGFSMGSTYFYLEFLLSWLSLLQESGFENPAIFGIDYTLVPDAAFPTQLDEIVAGYEHALSMAGDPARVCVAGDSAGGTLILSLLLHLANPKLVEKGRALPGPTRYLEKPGMAVLISPWPTLQSPLYQNNRSDFLDAEALQRYAAQYANSRALITDPIASPGDCKDIGWWKEAMPANGVIVTFGKEEVFAPEIEKLIQMLKKAGTYVSSHGEVAGIHAWPVSSLFLGNSAEHRLKRLRSIVGEMRNGIQPDKA